MINSDNFDAIKTIPVKELIVNAHDNDDDYDNDDDDDDDDE